MLYAMTRDNHKSKAMPGMRAMCPYCLGVVIAKCGDINVWHWAHRSVNECDVWSTGETEWHLHWKSLVPKEWCEVTIKRNGQRHVADIMRPDGYVFELQHSSLSPSEIAEREAFYGDMAWLFDIRACRNNTRYYGGDAYVDHRFDVRDKGDHHTFRWKHPRKHIARAAAPTFLDLGDGIFVLRKMYPHTPCGGWGHLVSTQSFVDVLTMGAS